MDTTEVSFDVYLMNGHRIPVKCLATDCSSRVLELVCAALDMPSEYTYYFGLFMLKNDEQRHSDTEIKRRLMDFESPFITQKTLGSEYKCVLRKSYWDLAYDLEVSSLFQETGLLLNEHILTGDEGPSGHESPLRADC